MRTLLQLPIEKKYQIKTILFTTAWCLLLLQILLIGSTLPKPPFRITIPCFFLLCLSAIYPFEYTLKEIVILVLTGSIALIVSLHTKMNVLIWVFAFIACSKGISIKPILFKTLIIYCSVFLIAVILSRLGLIEEMVRYNGKSRYLKHSFGLGDPNTTHAIFLIIVCLIFALFYSKLNFLHLIILLFANILLFSFTICKTSAGIVCFMLIAAIFEKWLKPVISPKIYRSILIALIGLMVFIVAFMTIMPIIFNGNTAFSQQLNGLFTGRFHLAENFYNKYQILPFGNYISEFFATPRVMYLDIGYAVLLLQYGYLFTVIFIGGYFALYIRFYKEENFAGILIVTAVLLFMTAENIMTIMFYNFSYFWFRDFIYKSKQ